MMKNIVICGVLAGSMFASAQAHAATTVLTFNTGEVACASATNDGAVGTQICTTSGSGPNGQIIGSTYGSSANLAVSYDASEALGSRTSLHFSTAGGGSATAFPPGPADELSKIFFTPATGFEVSFRSFDFFRGATVTSGIFRVRDAANNIIFTGNGGGLTQASGSFAPNTAYFAGPLTFEFGNGGSGFINVDNVTVDVRAAAVTNPVPEPTTWAMMMGGFGMLGGALRRRSRTSVAYA
jgi:YD repeat-containing protein